MFLPVGRRHINRKESEAEPERKNKGVSKVYCLKMVIEQPIKCARVRRYEAEIGGDTVTEKGQSQGQYRARA